MKDTLAIVVTYNRLSLLKQCIEHLRKQIVSCDILIVDNASTDNTAQFMIEQYDLFYLQLKTNTGGAGGFNAGMRWGVEHGYRYLWVMDDDTFPRPDALACLLRAGTALGNQFGFLASTPLWIDESPCRMNELHPLRGQCEATDLSRIEQSTFVSSLFLREIVLKYGLPIKDFFIWGDDLEYTRRIAVRGNEPSYWVKDSIVIHAMKSNNGSAIATDSEDRLDRYRYAYRNENYFYRREGLKGFLHYTARCGVHILRVLFHGRNMRLKRIGIIVGQYFKGLAFNPKVEYVDYTDYQPQ